MIRLDDEKCIIGFDDGYQLGKTANFIFDNGIHRLGAVEPTLKENSLFYDGEFFKVGEGERQSQRIRYRMILQDFVQWLLLQWNFGKQESIKQMLY